MPDSKARYAGALKKVPIFDELSESELGFLAQRAVPHQFKGGTVIFSEGDPCRGLFVVESGAIKVFRTSPSGREQVLAIEVAGHSLAELPLFDGGDYPASAMAMGETTLLFVDKRDFHALCRQHPDVALKVLKVVGVRFRKLVGIIDEISFTTVRHRLAALLLQLARRRGKQTARGIAFTLRRSNQELASHIGTVRELVSRNLSRFQAEGLVKMDVKTVIIPDLAALEAEVDKAE